MTATSPQGLSVDTTLVVCITLLMTVAPFLPTALAMPASAALILVTVWAWWNRCAAATPIGVFCVVCLMLVFSGVVYSQVILGTGLLAYFMLGRIVPWLHSTSRWVRRGSFSLDVAAMTVGSGLMAAVGLWVWYRVVGPNIDDIVRDFVPTAPLGVLVVGGLLFSIVNAAVEEGTYRGVIQHGLESTLGPGIMALVLQAMAFGALHINGFPRGWMGVGLATVFGLLMGGIRRQAHGMLAPWAAHVFTDIVIAGIVLTVERPNLMLHPTAMGLSLVACGVSGSHSA